MHISFELFCSQTVKYLYISQSTKGCHSQYLGLAPGKQSRTMGSWEHTHFTGNAAYVLGTPSVRPNTFVYNPRSYYFFGNIIYGFLYVLEIIGVFFRKVF